MAVISQIRQRLCLVATGLVLGMLAGVTTFVATTIFKPDVAEYALFSPVSDEAKRGGELVVAAKYRKHWDCGGMMVVTLIHQESGKAHNIVTQGLGDRAPGSWSILRRFRIPADAMPGPSSIQETLVYDCGAFRSVVRSPVVMFTVKE